MAGMSDDSAGPEEWASAAREGHNRLAQEKSPYLQQHATNPVDWYPWGDEAFKKAREEDKPLFISIGYSTCRWCHVMERESFEDPELAGFMNVHFVPVKVDREERPDVDRVYLTACRAYTGSAGWPLNVVTTPDGEPFFAATYLPPEQKRGSTGLKEVLFEISRLWQTDRDRLHQAAEQMARAIQGSEPEVAPHLPGRDVVRRGVRQLRDSYDDRHGGFGRAPKFPSPHTLMFLMRSWFRSGEAEEREMVDHTLSAMRRGGVFDHIGLGFHRYSTDRRWLVPHFEKMLYDQALMSLACTEASLGFGNSRFRRTAEDVLTYVLRDMRSPDGGFYAAEDAESGGEEGKFYVWTLDEWTDVLGESEGRLWADVFNLEEEGNFRDEATGNRTGANIPHLQKSWRRLAGEHDMESGEMRERWEEARAELFEAREDRQRPGRDEKQIAGWNGLMIAALARAGSGFGRETYLEAARDAADFVLEELRRDDGRLLRYYRDGPGKPLAYADDYAYLVWGLLELYQADFDLRYLRAALDLTDDMVRLFWDDEEGGFYLAGEDVERPITRPKDSEDGAMPSANSVAALNLLRLADLTTRGELQDRAREIMKRGAEQVERYPSAFVHLLSAVDFEIGPSRQLVVNGERGDEETIPLIREIQGRLLPRTTVLFCPPNGEKSEVADVCGWAPQNGGEQESPRVALCEDKLCRQPTDDPDDLGDILDGLT